MCEELPGDQLGASAWAGDAVWELTQSRWVKSWQWASVGGLGGDQTGPAGTGTSGGQQEERQPADR